MQNQSSNAELFSLLHTVLDIDYGIIVVNKDAIVTFVNKAYADFLGKSPDDMIGKYVDEAYVNSDPSKLPEVLSTGKPTIGDIFYLNGHYVITNRFPLYKNGEIVGAVGKLIFKDLQEFNTAYARISKTQDYKKAGPYIVPKIKYDLSQIIGQSPQIVDIKETIYKIAPRGSTVLLRGESGTGKELFANAIHNASHRRNMPFIKVNCAAIPEHLLESELFGYAEGAFTGAKKGGLKGKFELADKGTIFLDEIGDMSLNMQAKLLRVLQEKEIVPLGSTQTKKVDLRIIAATNVNLEELIKYGKFRADLFYRLNVVSLHIPALRERKEDIGPLVEHLVAKFNESFQLQVQHVHPEVLDVFIRYNWPGNVRELENVIEQAFNFVEGDTIYLEHIPAYIMSSLTKNLEAGADENPVNEATAEKQSLKQEIIFDKSSLLKMVGGAEKEMIVRALAQSKGNKAKAAQLLGLSRPGLYKKMARYNLKDQE